MTREEAILWLNEEIRTWENECQSKHPIKEALYAARKALEQEPNTWSLDDAREDFMHDVYNELDFLPTNEEANRIIDIFDRVTSSIEQEHKWIPVAERLPDEGYSVLVMRITDENYKYMRVATYQGDCWMDDTDKLNKPNPQKVIAWMPLPEPYKGGGRNEYKANLPNS